MRTTSLIATVMTLSIGAGAYAAVRGPGRAGGADAPIQQADFDRSTIETVHQAVHALRPEWVRSTGRVDGAGDPVVYIEMRCPEITCLRWVEADKVEEVQYLDPDAAGQIWLNSPRRPAIVVTLLTRLSEPSEEGQ